MCASITRSTKPDPRRSVGRAGEDAAAAHLQAGGFRVLERNYRCAEGEIDLVVASSDALVFCEVKTLVARGGARRGPAYVLEAVTRAKRARIRRLARAWLADRGPPEVRGDEIRFDAIGVLLSPDGQLLALEHLPSAW